MSDLNEQSRQSASGRLRRRDFLQGAAVLGIGAVTGTSIGSGSAVAATPRKGGTLRLGMDLGSASDSLDPRTYAGSIVISASLAVCNCLVEIDSKGAPTGELFESWETKPGATEWVFNVRQGIQFSTGKLLDADDCIYSINLHRGETKSPAKGILRAISEIKKLSNSQVGFTLSSGNIDFPLLLADCHLIVVPAGYSDWSTLVGTGAFTLESFEPGIRIAFKNRGDYWKPNRGNFDRVEIRYVQNVVARTSALLAGEVDGVNRLDPRTVKMLMKNPDLHVTQAKGIGSRYCFVSRVTADPYTNRDLRTALKWGIDRQKIVDTVYAGFAIPGNDHTLDPLNPFYNKNLPQRTYDPDKAAFFYKKAGLTNQQLQLQVSEGAWDQSVDCAQIYQQSLRGAEIDLDVKRVSADGYWSNVWLKVPFCAVYWSRIAVDQMFTQVYGSHSDWNDSDWRRQDFDDIVSAARIEADFEKRKALYFRAQEMIYDDGGMICFAIADYLDGYSKRVVGNEPHARFEMNDLRIAEKGWFA